MGDLIYLKITGEQQGNISSGCGTSASVGNRWQENHPDEIFVFSLSNGLANTDSGINTQLLNFTKLIDKSTPLLINAINNISGSHHICRHFYVFIIEIIKLIIPRKT